MKAFPRLSFLAILFAVWLPAPVRADTTVSACDAWMYVGQSGRRGCNGRVNEPEGEHLYQLWRSLPKPMLHRVDFDRTGPGYLPGVA